MSKALGSFSGMRKYLEQQMLAESLRGRIRYGCTTYVGMDGCHIFEVCIDGVPFKRFSWETVNSWFIENGYTQNKNPYGRGEYWAEFWTLLARYPLHCRDEYTDEEFCDALREYRNRDIHDSIRSENPLVRMFAVLDRRIGKRTLEKLNERVGEQPLWLQTFYRLRLEAESAAAERKTVSSEITESR
ncbi:MAG: hypothetical protein IJD06_00285 [Clostridia bacterium]|nr:hypothetical protein [Clostridia bacterium]